MSMGSSVNFGGRRFGFLCSAALVAACGAGADPGPGERDAFWDAPEVTDAEMRVDVDSHEQSPGAVYLTDQELAEVLAQGEDYRRLQEETARSVAGDKAPLPYLLYHFAPGDAANGVGLASTNDYVCYMTGFSGPLTGGRRFYVGWFSIPGQVEAVKEGQDLWVRCVPRTAYSGGGEVPAHERMDYAFNYDECGARSNRSLGYNGMSVVTLSGAGYDFTSDFDRVGVGQSSTAAGMNTMTIAPDPNRAPCRLVEYINTIYTRFDNNPVRFVGPNGTGTASQAGEWSYQIYAGQSMSAYLGATSTSECYFTWISGNVTSTSTKALIQGVSPGVHQLVMSAGSTGSIKTKVRCVLKAQ